MKLVALAFITVASLMPAYADEEEADPIITMAQCQAVDLSLMQQDNQIAASIAALSPTPPAQLALLRDSYRAMAKDEQAKVEVMGKLTKDTILPKIGEAGGQQFMAVLAKAIEAVQTGLAASDYDTQVKVQAKLLSASHDCEAFVAHLDKANTF